MFRNFINRDLKLEKAIARILFNNSLTLSTAESCTGGLLSSRLTDISGSSVYTKLNYVTYSNEAKNKILGVSEKILNEYGAVSRECARDMAEGLYDISDSDITICTTGIAGPTGGTKEKPVGLCYISCRFNGKTTVEKILLNPETERKEMKHQFAQKAIELAYKTLSE